MEEYFLENYELVASGEKWIGEGIKSSFEVISNLIEKSYNNLILTIFIIYDEKIWNSIKKAVKRNISVEIFIYNNDDSKYWGLLEEIKEFSKKFPNLIIYEKTDEKIHSKVIIADKSKVYLGSANLTNPGLNYNYELGIYVKDSYFAFKLETIIKKLIE